MKNDTESKVKRYPEAWLVPSGSLTRLAMQSADGTHYKNVTVPPWIVAIPGSLGVIRFEIRMFPGVKLVCYCDIETMIHRPVNQDHWDWIRKYFEQCPFLAEGI